MTLDRGEVRRGRAEGLDRAMLGAFRFRRATVQSLLVLAQLQLACPFGARSLARPGEVDCPLAAGFEAFQLCIGDGAGFPPCVLGERFRAGELGTRSGGLGLRPR